MKKIIYFTFIVCTVACMDKFDNQNLYFVNKGVKPVYTLLTYKELNSSENSYGIFVSNVLFSDKKYEIDRPASWDGYIKMSSQNKIHLYVIEKDSVDKYTWKGIYTNNVYNKKYTLDINDLDSLNWTIEYNSN